MIIRELIAKLGLDFDQTAMDKADVAMGRLKTAAGALVGLFAGGMIARGLRDFTLDTVRTADHLQKTADKLGIDTQALQEYQHAANLAGVETRTLEMGLQRFTRRVAEAAQGKGEAKEALLQMGLQLRDNEGRLRSSDALLMDVADAMAATADDGERLRLAFKLFDSEGAVMVNMLRDGSGALGRMRAEVSELGALIDQDFIDASVQMQDSLARLELSGMSLRVMLASKILPVVERLVEWFTEWWKSAAEVFKGTRIVEMGLIGMAAAAATAVFVLAFKLVAALGAAAVAAVKAAIGFSAAGSAALVMQLKMAAIGVLVILLIALVALLAEDIYGFFTGSESLIGDLIKKWREFVAEFANPENVDPNEHWMLTFLRSLVELIDKTIGRWKELVSAWGSDTPQALLDWLGAEAKKLPGQLVEASNLLLDVRPATVPPSPGAIVGGPRIATNTATIQHLEQHIHAGPGQSAEEVGAAASREMELALEKAVKDTAHTMLPATDED